MSDQTLLKPDRYWLAGGTTPVPSLTDSGFRFVSDHSRLLDLMAWIALTGMERAQAMYDAAEQSVVSGPSGDQDGPLQKLGDFFAQFDRYSETMLELVLCRSVDNFLAYIADLLACIYSSKPEMLISSDQERLDYILQHETMDELRQAIAAKRVEKLSYLGLRELADYLQRNTGFELFVDKNDLDQAAIIIEYRNVFVHNRGIIGPASVRRFPSLKNDRGSKVALSHEWVRERRQFLEHAVIDIDIRAAQKFSLEVTGLPLPPEDL